MPLTVTHSKCGVRVIVLGGTKLMLCCRFYCLSILDKHHHPDINLDQGLKILQMCTDELKRRLPIDYKGVRSPRFDGLAGIGSG